MSTSDSGIIDFSETALSVEDVEERVQKLRELVLEDDKLTNFPTRNEYLLRFLHCTDFNVHVAFKKMQDFCDLLLEHPKWFAHSAPIDKKALIEKYDKVALRERDKCGRSVIVLKLGRLETINACVQDHAQILEMWVETVMDDPKTQRNGLSVIVDMDGFSWRLFKWLTPSNIRTGAKRIDVYPLKEILIHMVNTTWLFNASIKLLWPLLNDKIKNMIKFHFDDWSSLHEYISPEVLPPEYDGTDSEINFEKSVQYLFDQSPELEAKFKHHKVQKQS